ncbi:hypothetical protein SAMN04487969_11923 [Paenibacillus algorifonticola]|uniref:Uncharacterized protein n=1 Tax=Paenibacillus algorifonticola TaxID=684063 RepID=A0A1I2GZ10_9BACL|nr:hypothetical protein [Paenibacillus algorifonticola]SFF22508.1 hypothetical protein SAMN04487969_11923 [Paenibacillus algorifonticola]
MSKLQTALKKVAEAIKAAQDLDRSREASVAITQLETAELWLQKIDVTK